MKEIASRYALALYSLANEKGLVTEYQEECKVLKKVLLENNDFIVALNSSFLSKEERIEMIDKTLSSFKDDIVKIIKIIIENNRANYLVDVLDGFNSLCNESRGVKEGLLYSTAPIDEQTKLEIEKKISQIEKVSVELINRIDPSLIGGVKVVIGNHIYDGSVKSKLESMRNTLLSKEDTNNEN